MPELPEVELGRKLAEQVACGRFVERVEHEDDDIVFDGVSGAELAKRLHGRRVEAVQRRGKHLWFELDERPWPLFHFGMTGAFRVRDIAPLPLESSPKGGEDPSWPPRFVKLHLWFDGGGELAFVNKRRLGRIRLREDPEREPPIAGLGFDPLTADLPPADFVARAQRRRTPVKALLLDQSFAAGVGNWIADEVLYQAKIDPRRRASELSSEELRRVYRSLRAIIHKAVEVDADKDRLPRTWLFHHRWGKDPDARTARGEAIQHETVGGRTTAWVPAVQR